MRAATTGLLNEGQSVAHIHLKNLNPLPQELGEVLKRYDRVIVAELNLGQLDLILRARYLIETCAFTKVKGKPFRVDELENFFRELIAPISPEKLIKRGDQA